MVLNSSWDISGLLDVELYNFAKIQILRSIPGTEEREVKISKPS